MTAAPLRTTSPRSCCARCAVTTPSRPASSSWPPRSGSGVYPLGSTLPPGARARRSAARSRGPPCARRWPRCAQAGLVETTRGRGGGTVVTMKPRTPSARAAGADHRGAAGRTGSTPSTSAGSSSPGAAHLAARARRSTSRPGAQLDAGARGGRRGPQPGPAPAGRLPLPPHRRRADRVAARGRGGHLRPGQPARDAAAPSPCWRPTSPTPTASTPRSCARSWRGDADRARQVMEEHCDDTAALLRGLLG